MQSYPKGSGLKYLRLPIWFFTPEFAKKNAEEMMADLLKEGVKCFTVACKPERQEKLLRDGFQKAGVAMEKDRNWVPISVQFKNTNQVFEEVERVLKEGGE